MLGLGSHVVLAQAVRHHELCKITHHLRCRRHLDDVAKKVVGFLVRLLSLRPLLAQTLLLRLEDQICELTTRDLVFVDLRVRTLKIGFEWRVEQAYLAPVAIKLADGMTIETRILWGSLERRKNGANARLRSASGHGVGGGVDRVSSRLRACYHRGDTSTCGVVCVHVNRQVRILGTQSPDKLCCGTGFEHASHILDTEDMSAHSHDLLSECHVVLEIVLLMRVLIRKC